MRVFRAAIATARTPTSDSASASSAVTSESTEPARSNKPRHAKRHGSAGSAAAAQALDTTMKHAIESLTHDDAESALVFALVHDSEFRLATAIASHPTGIDANVVRALLFVFESYEDQLHKLIGLLMVQEMVDTLNWNELFRANSTTTAIIREYTCELGMDFLQYALQDVLAELWDVPDAFEVNPQLLSDSADLAANQQQLEALADRILDRVCAAAHLFPYQVAKIYRVLETEMLRLLDRDRKSSSQSSSIAVPRLSAIGEDALVSLRPSDERRSTASLPRLSSMSIDDIVGSSSSSQTDDAAARDEFVLHLGGLLFLRFICPALVLPHKMLLTPQHAPPTRALQRTLVLVAKLFQALANHSAFDTGRESYMVPFNAFLGRNRPKLLRFYDLVCQQAQHDSRRESVILQSHATPRISQLWSVCRNSSSSSTNARDTVVNLTGATTVCRPDESVAVLQHWIRSHVSFLTKEVARDRRFKRRGASGLIVTSPGLGVVSKVSASTTSTTATTGKAKHKPKRKLKSSKSLSSLPHNSTGNTGTNGATTDMDAVHELDDDDVDELDKRSDALARSQSRSRNASSSTAGVSPQELDAVMGRTSHRDVQLMKLYYSKLSQRGLRRLLEATDPTEAAAWTTYRCKHDVDVFRKTTQTKAAATASSSTPRLRCPPVRLTRNATDRSRFVEMKASVVVRATPQRVFQYLRTLERMAEWDALASTVRRVEPIDDSRVIMYRTHPKLSFWPTWLVKPRDSCDLHSFVETIAGRFDTFAVVLESIPRPDVPELKGTVRMAYATGGFLVEPSFSDDTEVSRSADPSQGAFAKLTCVVRADFKGLLPRYLAESICLRQVLRIVTVKANIEAAARTPTDSAWI